MEWLRHPLWPVIRRKVPFFPNVSPPCHPPPTNAGPGSRNRISVRVESWLLHTHTHTWFRVFFFPPSSSSFHLLLLYCSLAVQQQQRSLQPHSHSGWVVRRISFFSYELRFLPFFQRPNQRRIEKKKSPIKRDRQELKRKKETRNTYYYRLLCLCVSDLGA